MDARKRFSADQAVDQIASGKGIFVSPTPAAQRHRMSKTMQRQRAGPSTSTLDKFAELLSEHVDAADIAAGLGTKLDPGGDVPRAARRMNIDAQYANALLQRIRRRLGSQAR